MVRRMVGIDFHAAQSETNAKAFYTPWRVAELRTLLLAFERGEFAKTAAAAQ